MPGLNDSKLLAPAVREEVYGEVVRRAVAWSVVVIPAPEVDRRGLHVCNLEGMRRAVARLDPGAGVRADRRLPGPRPDHAGAGGAEGGRDRGLHRGGVGDRQGDPRPDHGRACTTRWPAYEFATHKGYVTPGHASALIRHGPCPEHRFSYVNVRRVGGRAVLVAPVREDVSVEGVTA